MSAEPDYVNELPEGYPPAAPRCEHVFEHPYEYKGRQVRGRLCGLPVPQDRIGQEEHLCYFHSKRAREDDAQLKGELEAAVASGAYLGEARLLGAALHEAQLLDAFLPHANLEGASLTGANLQAAGLPWANLQAADLSRATLQGARLWAANLDGARLGDANLQRAELRYANLRRADLQDAKLQRANLQGADLQDANLQRANLQRTDLQDANLQGARLLFGNLQGAYLFMANLDGADLRFVDLHGAALGLGTLTNADMRATVIARLEVSDQATRTSTSKMADLEGADLRGALLSRARIEPEADLSDADIDCPLRDEHYARSDREWQEALDADTALEIGGPPTFAACEAVYRQLKLNFQESGDYQRAGDFFLREMECKRAAMLRNPEETPAFWGRAGAVLLLMPVVVALLFWAIVGKHPDSRVWLPWVVCGLVSFGLWAWPARRRVRALWMTLVFWLCGYGEQPWRIAVSIAAALVVFACLHGVVGIIDAGTGQYLVGPWLSGSPSQAFIGWPTCVYFSVITFTSLGYADLAPGPGWGRALAGIEAGLGFVLMSLLLVCVVRKFAR